MDEENNLFPMPLQMPSRHLKTLFPTKCSLFLNYMIIPGSLSTSCIPFSRLPTCWFSLDPLLLLHNCLEECYPWPQICSSGLSNASQIPCRMWGLGFFFPKKILLAPVQSETNSNTFLHTEIWPNLVFPLLNLDRNNWLYKCCILHLPILTFILFSRPILLIWQDNF